MFQLYDRVNVKVLLGPLKPGFCTILERRCVDLRKKHVELVLANSDDFTNSVSSTELFEISFGF